MKRILLLLMLFFGMFPVLHNGKLILASVNTVYADDFGNEDGDNNPCDPSSPAYNPSACGGSGDQCDEGSPSYNPSACEGATCTPGSPNYDEVECSQQNCDPSSVNYNASACGSTAGDSGNPCDPTSIAYDPATCSRAGEQCDESSANYNPSACEGATCAVGSPDYDETECTEQDCDETSAGYDYYLCELGNCDPTSPNYDDTECEASTCDPDSPNYNVDECDAQVCDGTSSGANDANCDDETCIKDNVNYDAITCLVWNTCATLANMEAAFAQATAANLTKFQAAIAKYAATFNLNSNAEMQQFMAQVSVETGGGFGDVAENENWNTILDVSNPKKPKGLVITFGKYFSLTDPNKINPTGYLHNTAGVENVVYANRMNNGSIASGDGSLYAGRGYLQLTGKINYQSFQQYLWDHPELGYSDVDIMDDPDLILNKPDLNVIATLNWFQTNVLNKITITSSTTADQISTIVNGGTNAKKERETALSNAKANIKCNN